MSNFYYLYKYGATGSGTSAKSFINTSDGSIMDNNFIGAMLEYNRFDLSNTMDFVTDNNAVESNANSFDNFYSAYKTIVGSDVLSYVNKYTSTENLALGNMLNLSDTPTSDTYTSNLVSAKSSFYFRSTQDGDLYRYTSSGTDYQGTAEGLLDTAVDTDTIADFDDLEAGYKSYYNYKMAQINGETTPTLNSSVDLSALGLDYATIHASAGTDTKAVYQNLIDQIVAESKALKAGTMSEEDIATMTKDLDDKQRGLKALDDALYGYVEDAQTITMPPETHTSYNYTASYNYALAVPNYANLSSIVVSGPTHTMVNADFDSLYLSIGNLSGNVSLATADPIGGPAQAADDFKQNLAVEITKWVDANPLKTPKNFDTTLNLADPIDSAVDVQVMTELDEGGCTITAISTTYKAIDTVIAGANTFAVISANLRAFVDNATLFPALSTAQRDRAYQVLCLQVQKDNYVNDLTNKILSSTTVAASSSVQTITETKVTTQNDITQREDDMNYYFGKTAIRIDDLFGFIDNIRDFSHSKDHTFRTTYAYDHPGTNIQRTLVALGINIVNTATGAVVPLGTAPGQQENIYSWLGTQSSSIMTNHGDGTYTFSQGTNNYLIDTNVYLEDLDASNIEGSLKTNYIDGADIQRRPNHTVGEMENRIKDQLKNRIKILGSKASESTLKLRHLKATDISKATLADTNTTDTDYTPNTDTNSLVYKLADSLLANNDITCETAGTTDQQKREFAVYLSEVSAGIMEKYWLENFNKADAEPIDVYFAREFRAYLNPYGDSSATSKYSFINSDGVGRSYDISFDENPATFNIVDKIMEKQSWAQIYTKIEDRSRLEMALFEESSAMDTIVNIDTKEYQYRMNMLAALESDASIKALGLDFSAVNQGLITQGPGKEKNPWWSEYFPWFKGFYGNLPDGATPDQMFDKDGHLVMKYSAPGSPLVDPYLVKINGVDYVMGKDDNNDGEISNAQEILGITDTIDTTFASLISLDTNKDNYISQEELKSQNIIFKAMNESERMNGSGISTDFIKGIDLSTLKQGDGTNNIYGLFNVQLTNGQKAAAVQTFESQSYFNNLFGKYADMSFLKTSTTSETNSAAVSETASKTQTKNETAKAVDNTKKTDTTKTSETKTYARGFNFFSYLKNEDSNNNSDEIEETKETKSEQTVIKAPILEEENDKVKTIVVNSKEITLDSLIDDICWKANIYRLNSKQKYEIIDNIDTSIPAELIVKKIQDEVEQIHKGFSA